MSDKITRILQNINAVNNASASGSRGFNSSIADLLNSIFQKGKGPAKDLYNVRNDDSFDEVNIDVPVIYGEVLSAGQKADGGTTRSTLDPSRTLQQYTLLMSEGECEGIVGASCNDKLKNCFIDGTSVLDESLGTASKLDCTIKQNTGDGNNTTFNDITGCSIGATDPVTGENLEEKFRQQSSNSNMVLNDLRNVNTSPCDNHILYYDGATNLWKSQHFNTMLANAGITVTGGVGGTGGSGGTGGTGGAATATPATDTFACLIPTADVVNFTTTAPPNNTVVSGATLLKYTGTNRYMTMSVDPVNKNGIALSFHIPKLYLEKVYDSGTRENTTGTVNVHVCLTGSPCGTETIVAMETFQFSGNTTAATDEARNFTWDISSLVEQYGASTLFPSNTGTLYIYRTDDFTSSTDILVRGYSYTINKTTSTSPTGADVDVFQPTLVTDNNCLHPTLPNEGNSDTVFDDNNCLHVNLVAENEAEFTEGDQTYIAEIESVTNYTTLSLTGGNDPCPTNDGTAQGAAGSAGSSGASGGAGLNATVNIPAAPECPVITQSSSGNTSAIYETNTNSDMPTLEASTNLANTNVTVVIKLEQGNGTIGATPSGSASITANNSAQVTIAGPVSDVNTVLGTLVYSSTTDDTGDIEFTATITDANGTSEVLSNVQLLESATESDGAVGAATITPSGSGDLSSLKFDGTNIIAGTVTGATASTIKDAINNHTSVPNFTATESAGVVTISAPLGFGKDINKKSLTGVTTGTLALSLTQFTGGANKTSKNTDKFGTTVESEVQGVLTNVEKGKAYDAIYFPNVATIRVEYPQDAEHGDLLFLYRGKKVQVPSTYTDSGTHPTTWNYTSFTTAYTNNPAWIFWDWIKSERYGLGHDIELTSANELVLLQDLFEASKYNNGTVNSERRFTCNTVVEGGAEKLTTLDSIASSMNAKTYWYKGQLRLWQDRSDDISKVVNQTNTTEISYTGASSRSLTNYCTVSFNSPQKLFKEDSVIAEDRASIVRSGQRKKDIFAYGCTSRNQAVRHGKWIIETDKTNIESVRYIAGLDHYDAKPGDVVSIEDSNRYTSNRLGVRVAGVSGTTLTLDGDTGFTSSDTGYSVNIQLNDGTVHTTTISFGSVSNGQQTATIGSSDSGIVNGSVANIYQSSAGARTYRITDVHELDANKWEVSAVYYDANKYNNIETNIFTGNT